MTSSYDGVWRRRPDSNRSAHKRVLSDSGDLRPELLAENPPRTPRAADLLETKGVRGFEPRRRIERSNNSAWLRGPICPGHRPDTIPKGGE